MDSENRHKSCHDARNTFERTTQTATCQESTGSDDDLSPNGLSPRNKANKRKYSGSRAKSEKETELEWSDDVEGDTDWKGVQQRAYKETPLKRMRVEQFPAWNQSRPFSHRAYPVDQTHPGVPYQAQTSGMGLVQYSTSPHQSLLDQTSFHTMNNESTGIRQSDSHFGISSLNSIPSYTTEDAFTTSPWSRGIASHRDLQIASALSPISTGTPDGDLIAPVSLRERRDPKFNEKFRSKGVQSMAPKSFGPSNYRNAHLNNDNANSFDGILQVASLNFANHPAGATCEPDSSFTPQVRKPKFYVSPTQYFNRDMSNMSGRDHRDQGQNSASGSFPCRNSSVLPQPKQQVVINIDDSDNDDETLEDLLRARRVKYSANQTPARTTPDHLRIIPPEAYQTPKRSTPPANYNHVDLTTPPINSPVRSNGRRYIFSLEQVESTRTENRARTKASRKKDNGKLQHEARAADIIEKREHLSGMYQQHDDLFEEDPETIYRQEQAIENVFDEKRRQTMKAKAKIHELHREMAEQECKNLDKQSRKEFLSEQREIEREKKHREAAKERPFIERKEAERTEQRRRAAAKKIEEERSQREEAQKIADEKQEREEEKEKKRLLKIREDKLAAKARINTIKGKKRGTDESTNEKANSVFESTAPSGVHLGPLNNTDDMFFQDDNDDDTLNNEDVPHVRNNNTTTSQNTDSCCAKDVVPIDDNSAPLDNDHADQVAAKSPSRLSNEITPTCASLRRGKNFKKAAEKTQLTQQVQKILASERTKLELAAKQANESTLKALKADIKKLQVAQAATEKLAKEEEKRRKEHEKQQVKEKAAADKIVARAKAKAEEEAAKEGKDAEHNALLDSEFPRVFNSIARLQKDVDDAARLDRELLRRNLEDYSISRRKYESAKEKDFYKTSKGIQESHLGAELQKYMDHHIAKWEAKRNKLGKFNKDSIEAAWQAFGRSPLNSATMTPETAQTRIPPEENSLSTLNDEKSEKEEQNTATRERQKMEDTVRVSRETVRRVNQINNNFAEAASKTRVEHISYDSEISEEDPDDEPAPDECPGSAIESKMNSREATDTEISERKEYNSCNNECNNESDSPDTLNPEDADHEDPTPDVDMFQEQTERPSAADALISAEQLLATLNNENLSTVQSPVVHSLADLEDLNKGKSDSDMIHIYYVHRSFTRADKQDQGPIEIQSFLDREDANKFAELELHKHRLGPQQQVYKRVEQFDRQTDLYSGEIHLDQEGKNIDLVFVNRRLRYKDEIANFTSISMSMKHVVPPETFHVIYQLTQDKALIKKDFMVSYSKLDIANRGAYDCFEKAVREHADDDEDASPDVIEEVLKEARELRDAALLNEKPVLLKVGDEAAMVEVFVTGPHVVMGPLN